MRPVPSYIISRGYKNKVNSIHCKKFVKIKLKIKQKNAKFVLTPSLYSDSF